MQKKPWLLIVEEQPTLAGTHRSDCGCEACPKRRAELAEDLAKSARKQTTHAESMTQEMRPKE